MTPDQKQAIEFATYKALSGVERKVAMRARLSQPDIGIDFRSDVHSLYSSQLSDCAAMGKAVGWMKSPASMMSYGAAFYLYLSRDLARNAPAPDSVERVPVAVKRRRWTNDDIFKG